MHELSIARDLLQLVEQHRPHGSVVKRVQVQVGPLQAIDREAMQFAWEAVTLNTELDQAELQLEMLPWHWRCPNCGRQWESLSWDCQCECGGGNGTPVGGSELLLESLDVTTPEASIQRPFGERTEAGTNKTGGLR